MEDAWLSLVEFTATMRGQWMLWSLKLLGSSIQELWPAAVVCPRWWEEGCKLSMCKWMSFHEDCWNVSIREMKSWSHEEYQCFLAEGWKVKGCSGARIGGRQFRDLRLWGPRNWKDSHVYVNRTSLRTSQQEDGKVKISKNVTAQWG